MTHLSVSHAPVLRPSPVLAARPRVLIAERDGSLRDQLAWEVAHMGCLVDEVRGSVQLRERFERALVRGTLRGPDVLITGVHGIEALRDARELGWYGGAIVLAEHADSFTRARAHDAGAWAVLHKPFDMARLLGHVRALLPAR